MSKPVDERCQTPRCVDTIAKYGERYHRVFARNDADGTTAQCEMCGARLIAGAWVSRCKQCKTQVEPGALGGLFVPHSCHACMEATRAAERARGAVCSACGKPFCDCCC